MAVLISKSVSLTVLLFVVPFITWSDTVTTPHNTAFIPDYYQQDQTFGGFPDKGKMYCGPVSVSNSLFNLIGMQLFGNCIDSIKCKENQYTLICKLGSHHYISTGSQGSSPSSICTGVEKFLSDNGFKNAKLSYYGWRFVPFRFRKGEKPDIQVIRDKLKIPGTAIWLNWGWYSYNDQSQTFTRTGGHWVTLVGFFKSPQLSIVIHDPETEKTFNDTIAIRLTFNSSICGSFPGLPIAASGYYQFSKDNSHYGIIDGAVILKLR